jgi:hypothetical protein
MNVPRFFQGAVLAVCWLIPADLGFGQGILHSFDGAFDGDLCGISVADAGDVNQDGYPDFIAGAKVGLNGSGVPAGSVRVYSGFDESELLVFHGLSSSDFFGLAVSTAGDLDGDGSPDIVVGAPQENSVIANDGVVRVFSGQTGATLFTWVGERGNIDFGSAVADAGDVNNDGFTDIVVGAWRDHQNGANSGAASVFSGLDGSRLYWWAGDAAGDELAWSVSGAGDTNSDGFADVIVATLDDDNTVLDAGGARLFSGQNGSILHQWDGDSTADWYGYSVAGLGDVNGDGHDDVLVGAPRDDNNGDDSGMVRAFSGLDYALIFQVDGNFDTRYGWSVADGGDIDGDGVPDALVGAPWTGSQSGVVHVISGVDGSSLYVASGPQYSNFGYFVSSAQDANLDGTPELIAGAPYDDSVGNNRGSAHVISLACGEILPFGTGCPGTGGLTPLLAVSGCLVSAGHGAIDVTNALGDSTGFLFLGTGTDTVPLGGGCPLFIGPRLPQIFPLPLSGAGIGAGAGMVDVPVTIPLTFTNTVTLSIQVAVIDPAGSGGYSTTNAVQLTIN